MKVLNLIIRQKYFDAILRVVKFKSSERFVQQLSRSYYSLMKKGLKSKMLTAMRSLSSMMLFSSMLVTTKTGTTHLLRSLVLIARYS